MFILENMTIQVYLIAITSLEMEIAQPSNGTKRSTANAVPHVPEVDILKDIQVIKGCQTRRGQEGSENYS